MLDRSQLLLSLLVASCSLASTQAADASPEAPQPAAGSPEPAPVHEEAAALLRIRTGFTNGDSVLPDWNTTAGSPCSWTGVECNNSGSVVAL